MAHQESFLDRTPAWEDLLEDYLDLKTSLADERREDLIARIRRIGIETEELVPLVAFSLRDRIFVLKKGPLPILCWLYDISSGRLLPFERENGRRASV